MDIDKSFAYGAFTRCGALFQVLRLVCRCLLSAVLQPRRCLDTAGLGCCAFARHYLRNHGCFLFLRVMRCFSSPGLPGTLCRAAQCAAGCPIRKSVLRRVFAPGHGLSQLVTSFVASESQGILHVPFSPFRFSFDSFKDSLFAFLRPAAPVEPPCCRFVSFGLTLRRVCVGIELPC